MEAVMTDFRRQRFSQQSIQVPNISVLLQEAQTRWLKPIEICEILRNHNNFQLSTDPPQKPASGSLFLFDRKTLRYFRKDGYSWRKKKDGKTVREAHERLKVGSVDVLHCYYAHGEDNPNFQRRSYWMLEGDLEHIVLVHYREIPEPNRTGFPHYPQQDLSRTSVHGGVQGNSVITSPSSFVSSPSEMVSSSVNQENGDADSGDEKDTLNTDGMEQLQLGGQQVPGSQNTARPFNMNNPAVDYGKTLAFFDSSPFNSELVNGCNVGTSVRRAYMNPIAKQEAAQDWSNYASGPGGQSFKDLAELDNIDISDLLQNPGLSKLSSLDPLEIASWSQLLDKSSGEKLASSSWKEIMDQITGNPGPLSPSPSDNIQTSQGLPLNFSNALQSAVAAELPIKPGEHAWNEAAIQRHAEYDWNRLNSMNASGVMNQACTTQPRQALQEEKKEQTQLQESISSDNNMNISASKSIVATVKKEQESYQKQDSFPKWMAKEYGSQSNLLQVGSVSDLNWETTLDSQNTTGDNTGLSQQMQMPSGLGPSLSQHQYFSIVDYSPDWSYSSGGAKVIVTGLFLDTLSSPSDRQWCIMFGEVEVPADILQTGALVCNAPAHMAGRVSFYVTCNDRVACSEVREFDFRPEPCTEKTDLNSQETAEDETLLLQIRLARMLSSFESFPEGENGFSSCLNVDDSEWLQIENLVKGKSPPFEDAKTGLFGILMKQKLQMWLISRGGEGEKGIHIVDDHGQGVLHMVAALGYEWALAPILGAGAGINFRDKHGWTALHWAAHCGRENIVCALLAANAAPGAVTDPTPKYPKGRTAAELASSQGHAGIAGYIAEASLTTHLTSLTLSDSEAVKEAEAIETVAERSGGVHVGAGVSEDQLSLKDTLAAVRNAALAAARIQAAFRAHSFRLREHAAQSKVGDHGLSHGELRAIVASHSHKSQLHNNTLGPDNLNLAATKIQCKYRAWKGRKDFLTLRKQVVKIQAHVRGHQVRKKYKRLLWTVSMLDKVILRWRRKGQGLRGFRPDVPETASIDDNESDNEDFLKIFRKQKEEGFEEELSRVQHMVDSPEAQHQYRRMLLSYQKAKSNQAGESSVLTDDDFMSLLE